MRTTHDQQAERYSQQYSEPPSDAHSSSGYGATDSNYEHLNKRSVAIDELIARLNANRNSITEQQLAEIRELLAG